ncbi:MAG: DsbA family protein [Myxococcota bacterium]
MRSRSLPRLLLLVGLGACGPQSTPANQPASPDEAPVERPTDLTASELRSYDAYLLRFPSPCGGDDTIATCLESGDRCKRCGPAAEFVARSIRSGFTAPEVEARYLVRFDPSRVRTIDVKGAPVMGPENATVTIVEFADFECPFCAASVPFIDSLVESYAPHVRVAFRHFPIQYHPHAELAARAAAAAQKQGKFWELHHLMFANRDRLEREEIETYARSLNLDMKRFLRDWDAESTAAFVKSDYEQGEQLDVRGTPTFFINGREFNLKLFDFGGEDLLAWIELEIELATGKPYER